jgi:hypothetical protein
VYFWKTTGTKAKLTEQSYKHHYLIGQLYVALRKTGKRLKWFHASDDKEARFDCAMNWQGVFVPFEVHRGTQPVEVVIEKAKYYARMKNCRPVWTVSDYRPNPFEEVVKTAKQSGQEILDALRESRLMMQPLVTPHVKFIADPLARVLVSPKNLAISLLDLASESTSD